MLSEASRDLGNHEAPSVMKSEIDNKKELVVFGFPLPVSFENKLMVPVELSLLL